MRALARAIRIVGLGGVLMWTAAASPPAAEAPNANTDIVVSADKQQQRSADQVVKDFTGSSVDEQAASWNDWICLRVEGLISPQATYLRTRIQDNLRQAGLHVLAKEDCAVNAEVVFPPDSDAYTQHFVKVTPGLYRDLDLKGFPPPEEVDQLLKPRAVRWLPVRRDVSVGGTSKPGDLRVIGFPEASHITVNTAAVKVGELVVIDYRRLHHVTWNQLADYVSMVLLTDPDMDTDYRHDSSILALFAWPDDGSRAPLEMTDRDHLIVKGFGKIDQLARPFAQRDTVARAVEAGEKTPQAR